MGHLEPFDKLILLLQLWPYHRIACLKFLVLRAPAAPSIISPAVSAAAPTPEIPAPSTPAARERSAGTAPVPSAPSSGSTGGDAGTGGKGENKKTKRAKVEPVTALEKGIDLEKQILAKKGECGNLCLQIRTLEFGAGLAQELTKFGEQFESLGSELVHTSKQSVRLSCFVCILDGILPDHL